MERILAKIVSLFGKHVRSSSRITSSSAVRTNLFRLRESPQRREVVERSRMTVRSDEAIVELVRNGDADAFGLLVKKYQDRIYSTIMNYVSNVDEANDLAQETFVKAYAALHRFHGSSAFYTWLYRIAINTAIDHLRKRPGVRVDSLEDDRFREMGFEPAADKSADPQHALSLKEQKQTLRQAISSLSEKLRTAVILHDVEGLSQEEVAAILNCPVGTVKSRVSRARSELRTMLADYLGKK